MYLLLLVVVVVLLLIYTHPGARELRGLLEPLHPQVAPPSRESKLKHET